jgi:hypothetical protein
MSAHCFPTATPPPPDNQVASGRQWGGSRVAVGRQWGGSRVAEGFVEPSYASVAISVQTARQLKVAGARRAFCDGDVVADRGISGSRGESGRAAR